jgi:hypothetical protein
MIRRGLRSGASGQGIVEHALVTALLVGMGTVALTTWAPAMVKGLDVYLHGIYIVLSLPFP